MLILMTQKYIKVSIIIEKLQPFSSNLAIFIEFLKFSKKIRI